MPKYQNIKSKIIKDIQEFKMKNKLFFMKKKDNKNKINIKNKIKNKIIRNNKK